MTTESLDALARRLRRLEDLEEIRRLYVDYGRHLDAGDAAAYAALFARDAKVRLGPVLRADGRAEIERAAAAMLDRTRRSGHSVHLIGTPTVELDGDTATGECVWVAVADADGGATRVIVGRHLDELVREDGRWRFRVRRGVIDVGSLP
jgi:uncharacterized protein (TIGR02246 family)